MAPQKYKNNRGIADEPKILDLRSDSLLEAEAECALARACSSESDNASIEGKVSNPSSFSSLCADVNRIVLFCPDLSDRNGSIHVINTALALHSYGKSVTIITCNFHKGAFEEDLTGINILVVGHFIPMNICGFFEEKLTYLRTIYAAVYTTLHKQSSVPLIFCESNSVAVPILRLFGDYKVLYFKYSVEAARRPRSSHRLKLNSNWFSKFCTSYANTILVPSKTLSKIIARTFRNIRSKPYVIRPYFSTNFLDREETMDLRSVVSVSKNAILFACVGSYDAASNYDLVLKSFFSLLDIVDKEAQENLHLVFAGCFSPRANNELYKKLKKECRNEGVTNVSFVLNPSVAQKKTVVLSSVAVISANQGEIFNRDILESFSLGKAVIGIDSGFSREVIENGVTGFVVPANQFRIAEAMLEFVRSFTIGKFMGHVAKEEFAKKYSFESFARHINTLVGEQIPQVRSHQDTQRS